MGNRWPPDHRHGIRISCFHPREYVERWDRLAAEYHRRGLKKFASRSGAMRADADAAKRLRHDLKNELNALKLVEQDLRLGSSASIDAAPKIAGVVQRILVLVSEPAAAPASLQNGDTTQGA